MKKILFASAATLAMTAGVASAQNITFSGNARMGVVYVGEGALNPVTGFAPRAAGTAATQFSARARMNINMKRTTDSGMEVGASFRVDNAGPAAGNTAMTGGSVYISGDFGKLTMGDVAGAVEGVTGNLPHIGFTEFTQRAQWLGNAGLAGGARTAVRYEYTFDGFTFMLSSDQLSSGVAKSGVAGIGVKYTFDGISVALGHEQGKAGGVKASHTMLGVEAKIDMVTLKALYGEAKIGPVKTDQWGVSAVGTFDAITVTGYYMKRLDDTQNYGIGASYNLGGGAALVGGVGRSSIRGTPIVGRSKSNTTADFGITMSF
jgi:outer membrane protein OmpU